MNELSNIVKSGNEKSLNTVLFNYKNNSTIQNYINVENSDGYKLVELAIINNNNHLLPILQFYGADMDYMLENEIPTNRKVLMTLRNYGFTEEEANIVRKNIIVTVRKQYPHVKPKELQKLVFQKAEEIETDNSYGLIKEALKHYFSKKQSSK